jgi:mannitol/fructose-specific phosphotransferase system IIA component (Ntr-type)
MKNGIALPHGKTDGVDELAVAVGIKKEGVEFEAIDGQKSRLFILAVSPKKVSGPHIQFLAAIGALLRTDNMCEEVINAGSAKQVADLLHNKNKKNGS